MLKLCSGGGRHNYNHQRILSRLDIGNSGIRFSLGRGQLCLFVVVVIVGVVVFVVFFFVLLTPKVFLCQVVATVAGPKSVINMELYKSNLTEELNKFVNNIL